jgi:superfamily II DNA or RNA helicase
MIEDGKLLLPRGTSISRLENICDVKAKYIQESDPSELMSRKFYPVYEPRNDVQKESIEFLTGKQHQLALNLKTGIGKTYCVAYAVTKLNEKALIITPNESIKQQWINTFIRMFDYRPKDLMNIAGSNIMAGLVDGSVEERNVYFVNHQTLRSYMTTTNGYQLHEFFKRIKVGIKVYDESHMDFANILLMDYYSNTNRTWYITATFDRSEKTESECFKRAFNSVETYGDIESSKLVDKHVVYHVVKINSRISPKDRSRVIGYAGMTAASYGKYAFLGDPNNTAYNAILEILNKVKDVEGKVLIFVPLIEAVDEVVRKLKKDVPDKSVAAYHSKCTKEEKESAEKKDIIVSTIKSCGTGRDIPGLRVLICCEPVASKVVAEQMIGRLRPYGEGKDTYFWDIVDICLAPINWWWKARYKKIQDLVKKTVYIDLDS